MADKRPIEGEGKGIAPLAEFKAPAAAAAAAGGVAAPSASASASAGEPAFELSTHGYASYYQDTAPAPSFLSLYDGDLFRSLHGHEEEGGAAVHPASDDMFSQWSMGSMASALPALGPSDDAVLKPAGFAHGGYHAHTPSPLDPKFDAAYASPVLTAHVTAATGVESGPPLAPGGYLEPCYHFFSSAAPRVIIETAVSILQAAEIDCRVRHEKFRLSAKHFHGAQLLAFSVRVFATEGFTHRFAIEFQRRSGDVIIFNSIYRTAKQAMERIGGLVEATETPTPRATAPTYVSDPLPPLDAADSLAHQRDAVKSLLNMAASRFTDVKSQALSAICDMTHNCSTATTTMMLSEGAVARFSESLASEGEIEEVHRAAVTAVANLSFRREDVGTAVMAARGLHSLVRLSTSDAPQLVRESARALASLATAVGTRMDCDELRGALRSLMISDDARARHHSQELRKTLRITAV